MSTHALKARSLVPAVPKREALARKGWFELLLDWWAQPPAVPEHLREDVGLPPKAPSIFDFPLVDLRHHRSTKNDDWLN